MRPKVDGEGKGHINPVPIKKGKEFKKEKEVSSNYSILFQAMVLNHQVSQEVVKMAFVCKNLTDLVNRIPGKDAAKIIRFRRETFAFWEGFVHLLKMTKVATECEFEWHEIDLTLDLP